MLSKKNSETLENFSEKLEVEGRSLWQDARRRFMHNRAAVASLIVLVLIALFVILAPMLSQFAYDDTDWAMMSSAPDKESGVSFDVFHVLSVSFPVTVVPHMTGECNLRYLTENVPFVGTGGQSCMQDLYHSSG